MNQCRWTVLGLYSGLVIAAMCDIAAAEDKVPLALSPKAYKNWIDRDFPVFEADSTKKDELISDFYKTRIPPKTPFERALRRLYRFSYWTGIFPEFSAAKRFSVLSKTPVLGKGGRSYSLLQHMLYFDWEKEPGLAIPFEHLKSGLSIFGTSPGQTLPFLMTANRVSYFQYLTGAKSIAPEELPAEGKKNWFGQICSSITIFFNPPPPPVYRTNWDDPLKLTTQTQWIEYFEQIFNFDAKLPARPRPLVEQISSAVDEYIAAFYPRFRESVNQFEGEMSLDTYKPLMDDWQHFLNVAANSPEHKNQIFTGYLMSLNRKILKDATTFYQRAERVALKSIAQSQKLEALMSKYTKRLDPNNSFTASIDPAGYAEIFAVIDNLQNLLQNFSVEEMSLYRAVPSFSSNTEDALKMGYWAGQEHSSALSVELESGLSTKIMYRTDELLYYKIMPWIYENFDFNTPEAEHSWTQLTRTLDQMIALANFVDMGLTNQQIMRLQIEAHLVDIRRDLGIIQASPDQYLQWSEYGIVVTLRKLRSDLEMLTLDRNR